MDIFRAIIQITISSHQNLPISVYFPSPPITVDNQYYFQVYSTVVGYLYNSQSDSLDKSSTYLAPYIVSTILCIIFLLVKTSVSSSQGFSTQSVLMADL